MKLKYHVTPGDTIQTELGIGLVTAVEVTQFDNGSFHTELVSVVVDGSLKLLKLTKEMKKGLEENTLEVDERYTGGRKVLVCTANIKTPYSCDLALKVEGRKSRLAIRNVSIVPISARELCTFKGLLGAEVKGKWHGKEVQGKVQAIKLQRVAVDTCEFPRESVILVCEGSEGTFRLVHDCAEVLVEGEDCTLPVLDLYFGFDSISVDSCGLVEINHKIQNSKFITKTWCKLTKEEMTTF